MNSEYFQKKRKLEKQGVKIKDDFSDFYGDREILKDKNYSTFTGNPLVDLDDVPISVILGTCAIVFSAIIGTILYFGHISEEKKTAEHLQHMKLCHDTGREYIVIDRERRGKYTVDVYGCVNKEEY